MLSKVSVIIPTINSWDNLKASILSIYNQTLRPLEIIVVDNNSSDETSEKVKKEFRKVKLISLNKNSGVTGGRNTGIEAANENSQYLFFFDHDMIAEKNMLANLVKVANENKLFGILTPKIYYLEDKRRIWAAGTNINLWTGQILFRGGKDRGQFDQVEEVQVAPAAMLVKRQVIDKIKKFDNRYFATYEDTDFCFRAKKFNFKIIYIPSALAYHNISTSPANEQKRLLSRSFWVARNRIIFMKDFGKNYLIFLFFSPIYILYFIKMAFEQKDFHGFINYLRGFIVGIQEASKL